MKVTCRDLQELSSPLNGAEVVAPDDLWLLLAKLPARRPFLFDLIGDNGYQLSVGIAAAYACVQHSPASGDVPYYMAVSDENLDSDGFMEFLVADTPTPISRRYCLSYSAVKEVVAAFVRDGTRSDTVSWEEI